MKIYGMQKLSLLDYPGKMACTIFTGGCNFRCPFCHNASLVTDINEYEEMNIDDVFSYLKKRVGVLEGVCITGGEPLINDEVYSLIKEIRKIGYLVKLDTNGSFPKRLKYLVENDLVDYVAMDIKNSKEKYGESIGINNYDILPIEESVDFLKTKKVKYEFRTTIVKELHSTEDIIKITKWIDGTENYFLQNFVDSGNTIEKGLHSYTKEELTKIYETVKNQYNFVQLRGV